MMTARSEYRLSLRHSNADARLTPIGREYGLISDSRWKDFTEKQERIHSAIEQIRNKTVTPSEINAYLSECGTSTLTQSVKMDALLRRPQVQFNILADILHCDFALQGEEAAEVSHIIKYEQYIQRQEQQNAQSARYERIKLPKETDYTVIHGLSSEAVEKLGRVRPENLSQASRISGVSPADISILQTWLKAGGKI